MAKSVLHKTIPAKIQPLKTKRLKVAWKKSQKIAVKLKKVDNIVIFSTVDSKMYSTCNQLVKGW